MWVDLLSFIPLALLCNTSFPVAFDPVLMAFVATHSPHAAWIFALCGSICAGVAGVADSRMLREARRHVSDKWLKWLPFWQGRRFYLLTFTFALLPLPFSVVRLAVVRNRPRMIPYGLAIVLGKLPRYLLLAGVLRPVL
jgi:membrane protein YqaA with SNARE-associated domain